MDYSAFLSFVQEGMEEHFGASAKVRIQPVTKNNGIVLDGLSVFHENCHTSPTIYLDAYFRRHQSGEPKEALLAELAAQFTKDPASPAHEACRIFPDFQKHRSRIIFRLVNYKKNAALLAEIPHVPFLDLAIIFYCMVEELEGGIASFRITNRLMEEWNIDTKTLYLAAMQNMPTLFPARLRPIRAILLELLGISDAVSIESFPLLMEPENTPPLYVLTSQNGINGASVLLYPNILKDFAASLNSDLYVLPSSIHEVILLPVAESPAQETLSEIIREINQSQLTPEEVLSDRAYRFRFEDNAFENVC